ncbi:hypothetical protein RBB50_008814 [Rhinocladiella similis]
MSNNYSYSSSSATYSSSSNSGSSTSASSSSGNANNSPRHHQGHSQRYTETVTSNDRDGTTVRRTHEETGKPTLDETYHAPAHQGQGGGSRITNGGGDVSDQGRIQDVTDGDPEQDEKDRQYLERMEDE